MQFHLVFLASLFAFAACSPAADMARLLRSCDHNADNALNAAEFAGCLTRTSGQQRMAARRMGISRSEVLQTVMAESNKNRNMRADDAQLQERSEGAFDQGLLRSGDEDAFGFNAAVEKAIALLQYVAEENYSSALSELYSLISDFEFSASSREFLNEAATELYEENYSEVIGYMFSFIREIAGTDDSVQSTVVCASTVTNIASLLQVVIVNDTENVDFYIHRSLAGVIKDLSSFSEENAIALAAIIRAVVEEDFEEFYSSSEAFVNIPGVSTDVVTALTGLNSTIVGGSSSEISAEIFAVLYATFENENVTAVAQLFSAVTEALLDDNRNEAIEQLTLLLYIVYGSTDSQSTFSSDTLVGLASIITALGQQNDSSAVALINALIGTIRSGLSYSQITALEGAIEAIDASEYDEAIAKIVAIATSGGCSGVEISVEVFVALSSVVKFMDDHDDSNGTIALVEDILSNSSITVRMEIRSALRALIAVLSEDSAEEALAVITAIMTSSSRAFDRNISPQVAKEVQDTLDAIESGDLNAAIAIVEALLRAERGGSSLSVVVLDDLKTVLNALRINIRSISYSVLTVIAAGKRLSSLPTSATAALIVAIHSLSTGQYDAGLFAMSSLEPLLVDEDLPASFRAEIQAIINDINGTKYAKALSAVVICLLEPSYTFSEPVSQSLYDALQLTIAGNSSAAIDVIESFVDDLNADLRLVLNFFIHILLEAKVFGATIVLNVIISEAD